MRPRHGIHSHVGARPGALMIREGSAAPVIKLMEFDKDAVEERDVSDLEELRPHARTQATTWIDIQGLGDESVLREIGEIFGIHRLALADAVNIPQRSKAEEYENHLLVIAHAPDDSLDSSGELPQVCILIGDGYLVSFQERDLGFFDGVRARIRNGAGLIRTDGPAYLGYALLDSLVDHFYPVVAQITEELDDLEAEALDDPDPESVARLYQVQRRITSLRRVVRPQVEALFRLSHSQLPFIPESTRVFLKDVYDHARQTELRLDAAREGAVDAMNAVLATLSHRQNEIMKMLTLVGSIFIPLTFLAGIYGMNFENMPELKSRIGYPLVLGAMVAVAIAMVVFFRYKGWIGGRGGS